MAIGRLRGLKFGKTDTGLPVARVVFDYLVGNGHRVGYLGWHISDKQWWISEEQRMEMRRQAELFCLMQNGGF